jgi:tetratricopeptide (TPR) repeat protein
LHRASNCYSAAGRSEEALTAAEEAVALARRLAAVDPGARPFLATALSNLGGRYGEAGRSDDRLAAAEEAVATFRALDADAFAPNFGAALRNLAICYHLAGRKEDAVATAEEAVRVYTRLAADNPQFAPVLADAIGDLGGLSGRTGRSA